MENGEIKKACSILELFYRAKDRQALLEASRNEKLHPFVVILIVFAVVYFRNLSLLFGLVVPFFFSPRVVGEVSMFVGKIWRSQTLQR